MLLNSLFQGENQKANLCAFLAKWIEYTGKIPGGKAREICYLGQGSLLVLTQQNQELAGLRVS